MSEFETLLDIIERFGTGDYGRWDTELSALGFEKAFPLGDRHGSWMLAVEWEEGGMVRSADLAFTNPEVVPADVAQKVVVSVRSSASTESHFVVETIHERQHAVNRVRSADVVGLLRVAVERAGAYEARSLSEAYQLPTGGQSQR